MGDSVPLETPAVLTNGHHTSPPAPGLDTSPDLPPNCALKPNLHPNGFKKASRNGEAVKHHVTFRDERSTVSEWCEEGGGPLDAGLTRLDGPGADPHELEGCQDSSTARRKLVYRSETSRLQLDEDGFPVYTIESPGGGEGGALLPQQRQCSVVSSGYGSIDESLNHSAARHSPATTTAPAPAPIKRPVIRLQRWPSTDSHENPFQQDGELSKKADFIVRNSTISRTELHIADPDRAAAAAAEGCDSTDGEAEESAVVAEESLMQQSASPVLAAAPRPSDIGVKAGVNGQVDSVATPQSVQVEVSEAEAPSPAQHAEQVKLKKRNKCCVVQ